MSSNFVVTFVFSVVILCKINLLIVRPCEGLSCDEATVNTSHKSQYCCNYINNQYVYNFDELLVAWLNKNFKYSPPLKSLIYCCLTSNFSLA
jgi:hypothetical protein